MEYISKQNCPSLTNDQITSLRSNGFQTIMHFIMQDSNDIMRAGSISNVQYESLKHRLIESIRPMAVAATQLMSQGRDTLLSTGVPKLDDLLGGGLAGGEILEIYGRPGTCKTQLCLQIAAQLCRNQKQTVAYFDLKNDFRATRFLDYCKGSVEDLRNILIIRSSTLPELVKDVIVLKEEVSQQKNFQKKLKLAIFDSVPMVIYPAVEEDSSTWRFYQEEFFQEVTKLSKLNSGIAIIFVNHSVKASQKCWLGNQPTYKPALGKYWEQKPDFRLYVSTEFESSLNTYEAVLEKSTRTQTMTKFEFTVEENGINCLYKQLC